MERFISILIKSWLSVQVAIVLAITTHFTSLLWAMQSLHVPRLLITIISFMYRYLFVLADEVYRMARARQSRSAVPNKSDKKKNNPVWQASVTGWMVGQLFLRSYERSERVYNAMASRGYRGEIKQLDHPALAGRQVILGAVPVLATGLVILISTFWG
jgi:cobalt/nickel transport system permease protein